jgi:hypothetical protein
MGEYVLQGRTLNSKSVYVGGIDENMALWFDDSDDSWTVSLKEHINGTGWRMLVSDPADHPEHIDAPWMLHQEGSQPTSVRVSIFRESILKLSGVCDQPWMAESFEGCMGRYTRQARTHQGRPTFQGGMLGDMAIWFMESTGTWHVSEEDDLGTHCSYLHANDRALTPGTVRSPWMMHTSPAPDSRVQVCSALTKLVDESTASAAPPKLAFIALQTCSWLYGVYTKQHREEEDRAVYTGGRDRTQAIWYSSGRWCVGDAGDIGTSAREIAVSDAASTPDAVEKMWQVPVIEACANVRVTKSKKKYTKVIEVKGVPAEMYCLDDLGMRLQLEGDSCAALLNGKYRQQGRMVGGRHTFKGGEGGEHTIWYNEGCGSWQAGKDDWIGRHGYYMNAKDTAATPDAVKAQWHVHTGFKLSPYPNVIVPSVEAAEKEVPRLVQLKMCELMAAQHKRCLNCGHEYTTAAEVVFQMSCMHHHCMCCGAKEAGYDACAVCAAR